jgi:fibronectin type III domain protein/N-acetylmuramoyl-L-alanine amidase-like protein
MNRIMNSWQRVLLYFECCRFCYPVYSLVVLLSVVAGESTAAGLVPVGTQPHGGLSGKIVYTHGGHGITADNKRDGRWTFQRGPNLEMIEDLGNVDQMAFLVDYLFRAGATVVPLRPVGDQPNEVVLDNDDDGVTFEGDWSTPKEAPVYFGKAGHVPYRQAVTSKKETAHARYTPKLPEAGFYPVYAWTSSGGDRATDQLYRVKHAGGITEVTVNHRRVGNGLVYLGTYYFDAGTNGYVDVSNRSDNDKSIVVADMIRFGNGKGDISRGKAGVSKWDREDESGLYWVKWHADRAQGVAESDYRATDVDRQAAISFSPRYAAYMNREADGRLQDRVFVSFHSNAGGKGKARGTLGLLNGNNDPKTATPNQLLLAKSLAKEVNDDLVAQNGTLEHDWFDRGNKVTQDREDIEFGEINNLYINNEFDATIIEVAFHDNKEDAELMRTAQVRDSVGRATYKGLIKYFRAVDDNKTPATVLPPPVTDVHAESHDPGSVTISWVPPKHDAHTGDAATSYRVYASTNGYGFDGGTDATSKDKKGAVIRGLDPKVPHYFRVVAVNEGGESEPSEVVAALPSGGEREVLVVNGFDRQGHTLNPKQTYQGKSAERVRPRRSNSRDYVVQVASAIHAVKPEMHVASTSNEAVISGAVKLTDYKTVVWILGEESTTDFTFDSTEQEKVEEFVEGNGNLFVTGSEIAWDVGRGGGSEFLKNTLGASFLKDSAATYDVKGTASGIFAGLKFSFDNGTLFYDVDSPDVIAPEGEAKAVLNYANGAGVAGVQVTGDDGRGKVVMFAFPFETITTAENRAEVMKRVLDFFKR